MTEISIRVTLRTHLEYDLTLIQSHVASKQTSYDICAYEKLRLLGI